MDTSGDPVEIIDDSQDEPNVTDKLKEICNEQETLPKCDDKIITAECEVNKKEELNLNETEHTEKADAAEDEKCEKEQALQICDENFGITIDDKDLNKEADTNLKESDESDKRNLLLECDLEIDNELSSNNEQVEELQLVEEKSEPPKEEHVLETENDIVEINNSIDNNCETTPSQQITLEIASENELEKDPALNKCENEKTETELTELVTSVAEEEPESKKELDIPAELNANKAAEDIQSDQIDVKITDKKVPLDGIEIPSDDNDDNEDDDDDEDDEEDSDDSDESDSSDVEEDDEDDDDSEDNRKSLPSGKEIKEIKIKKTSQDIYDEDVSDEEDDDDDDEDPDPDEDEDEQENQEMSFAVKKPKIDEKLDEDDDIMILSSDDEDEKPSPPKIEIKPSTSGLSLKPAKSKDDDDEDKRMNDWDEDDDMDSEYDDDDLMNDVVMASAMRKNAAMGDIYHRKSRRIDGRQLTKHIQYRKKMKRTIRQFDYRSKAKNRSIKWFCSKMLHHSADDLIVQQQMAIIDDLEYTASAKPADNKSEINCFENLPSEQKRESSATPTGTTTTTPSAATTKASQSPKTTTAAENNNNLNDDGDDVIELDSSPEKQIATEAQMQKVTPTKDSEKNSVGVLHNSTLKENSIKMQPLDKVRETIAKSQTSDDTSSINAKDIDTNDTHENRREGSCESDQNKENVEKRQPQLCQQNGRKDDAVAAAADDQGDMKAEVMNAKAVELQAVDLVKEAISNGKNHLDDTVEGNEKSLDAMDVSEISTESENDAPKNEIKKEPVEPNEVSKTIEIPVPPSVSPTPTAPNRKRMRSRSNTEDTNDLSNNIQLTSTPLLNHKKDQEHGKRLNPLERSPTQGNNANTAANDYNNGNFNEYDEDDEQQIHPTKKLRAELETNFTKHDRILAEYIERTTNETPNEIDKHISQLAIEIQTLNDMIKAKEYEWNNMLHLKKVKEEICFRLTRKKQVIELMATKLGEISNHVPNATTSIEQNLLGEKLSLASHLKIPNLPNHLPTTTVGHATTAEGRNAAAIAAATSKLFNYSNAAATALQSASANANANSFNGNSDFLSSLVNSTQSSSSAAQNILQLRANMKSSDLAKEKNNAQKIHRLLVSRNILPKPSSTATSGSLTEHQQQQQQQLATYLIQNANGNSNGNGGGGTSASQLANLSGLFGSATAPIVISTSNSAGGSGGGGGGAVQIPLPLSNVATGSLLSAHTPPGASNASNSSSNAALQHEPTILNNYLTSAASLQQALGDLHQALGNHNSAQAAQTAHNNLMVGRQGVFKDVKSIIADYRQRHPEQVPRRGRRMKSTNSNDVSGGGANMFHKGFSTSDLNNIMNRLKSNSRPSSNDSSSNHSSLTANANAVAAAAVAANLTGANVNVGVPPPPTNISFKDVLVQFAKLSGQPLDRLNAAAAVAASTAAIASSSPHHHHHHHSNSNTNTNNNHNSNSSQISNRNNDKNNNSTSTTTSTTTTATDTATNLCIGPNSQFNSNTSAFPEVTLHPVSTSNQTADQSGSLLHGILTKFSRAGASSAALSPNSAQNSILNAVVAAGQQQTSCAPTSTTTNYNSTFSPTLARLLTAPERITNNLSGSQNSTIGSHQTATITAAQAAAQAAAAASHTTGLNLTKVVHNNEITITPVINSGSGQPSSLQQSLLQKQIKDALNISKNISASSGSAADRIKSEYFMNIDDEADDSVDRLVIDEGGGEAGADEIHRIAPNAIGQEFHENEVPWCQGCKSQEAQFVCAGCGSQWYCSRECQVQAWDEHSETCTG